MESRSHILRRKHESRVSIESTVMPPFRCSLSASHHQHPPSVRAGRSQRQCARGSVANIGRQREVVPTESCCVDSGTLAADGRARGHYGARACSRQKHCVRASAYLGKARREARRHQSADGLHQVPCGKVAADVGRLADGPRHVLRVGGGRGALDELKAQHEHLEGGEGRGGWGAQREMR